MAEFKASEALSRIKPSPTIAMSQKAIDLKRQGKDVIALAAGEPDFPTPEHIAEAGIRAIRDGKTQYTSVDGIMELKEAVAAKFTRDNSLTYDPGSEICVASGGKFVLYAALMATVDKGDEVIIPAPYWVSYPGMTKLAGGEPVFVETKQEDGFRLMPDDLEAAITPKTRWLILNSPSNPTGAILSRSDLKALADVLMRHPHVWVLTDDIYEHVLYDAEFATIAEVEPGLKDRTLTMNGASKAYSMTGWRIGYAGGPAPLMAAMRKLFSQSTTNPCSISQWAAVAALEGPHDFLAERNKAFRERRDFLLDAFDAMPGISCEKPEGAFYLYPRCEGLIGKSAGGKVMETDLDVAEALLVQELVALVPGTAFGKAPYLRLSYAASMESLQEAAKRIARFCDSVR
ncbi:pyridoxal phosphate-dependent aminotransferase [Parvularcula sp. ZS-1/3]|uniref:Aminotransferase n=1 Tax=Parvularcula mediterranea TaxID=2732508 RepID=A0A7Y3RJR5_9PROT|nr:pyridoxal phosphate-dependent aminotransferase [Parvularcula mediterranea]NNU15349.1 pyridoxal phosphate-dependent aminotransferase [Parvularcula mediterranea]